MGHPLLARGHRRTSIQRQGSPARVKDSARSPRERALHGASPPQYTGQFEYSANTAFRYSIQDEYTSRNRTSDALQWLSDPPRGLPSFTVCSSVRQRLTVGTTYSSVSEQRYRYHTIINRRRDAICQRRILVEIASQVSRTRGVPC